MYSNSFQFILALITLSNFFIFGCTSDESYDNSDFTSEVETNLPASVPFVAVGGSNSSEGNGYILLTSDDGNTWENISLDSLNLTSGSRFHDVTYGNGMYVVVGDSGNILYSKNSKEWSRIKLEGSKSHGYVSIAYGKNRFFATGGTNSTDSVILIESNDGINWNSSFSKLGIEVGKSIEFCMDMFFLITDNRCLKSEDGTNWETSVTCNFSGNPKQYCINNKIHVTENSNAIYKSLDGNSFTSITFPSTSSTGIAYGNDLYVVGSSANIYYNLSFISVGWSQTTNFSDNSGTILSIIYRKSKFIAAGGNSIIYKSDDGLNWTRVNSGTSNTINSIY